MTDRFWLTLALIAAFFAPSFLTPAPACAPCPPSGKPVVNADQTVIILWDAANKTEHFIRRASFKSDADDFGFLVPTPAQPDLQESGDEAFPYLQKLTEPEVRKEPKPSNIGCSCGGMGAKMEAGHSLRVLEEKRVAGFNAVVLETQSADALTDWLKDHGYAYSPEVRAWAKPYVEAGWKITALKVAKSGDSRAGQDVAASALRMSFQTDRPLFPYREPDPESPAAALGARSRLLRIYLLAEARYQGEFQKESSWTGRVAWAGKLTAADREKTLDMLRLPKDVGPAEWWLTEFEDRWPYKAAPADVYFSRAPDQSPVKRRPIVEYVSSPWPSDVTGYALAAVLVVPPLVRRVRKRQQAP
jgi:hypothetical protein